VLGKPSNAQRDEYGILWEIYAKTIEQCRPGDRAGDVFDFTVNEFKKRNWEYKPMLVGHGVGSWWHQQEPIIARGTDIILEEDMVLAIEPHRGVWHIQDHDRVAQRRSRKYFDKDSDRGTAGHRVVLPLAASAQ
jgi:Xaa-Pro aminopeptidase